MLAPIADRSIHSCGVSAEKIAGCCVERLLIRTFVQNAYASYRTFLVD